MQNSHVLLSNMSCSDFFLLRHHTVECEREMRYCEESQGHLGKCRGALRNTGFGVSQTRVLIPVLPLPNCVMLGMLLNASEPQCPPMDIEK